MTDFNKKVADIVEKRFEGVLQSNRINPSWIVKTKAGDLRISISLPESSSCFTIFACFDDNKKAVEVLEPIGCAHNLNYHVGKWNHHSTDFQNCLDSIFEPLAKIV